MHVLLAAQIQHRVLLHCFRVGPCVYMPFSPTVTQQQRIRIQAGLPGFYGQHGQEVHHAVVPASVNFFIDAHFLNRVRKCTVECNHAASFEHCCAWKSKVGCKQFRFHTRLDAKARKSLHSQRTKIRRPEMVAVGSCSGRGLVVTAMLHERMS